MAVLASARAQASGSSTRSTSSASSTSTHSVVHAASAKLRALEKSSHQVKRDTRAPRDSASAAVPSVDPVSTTTASPTQGSAAVRQRDRRRYSLRTIMHRPRRWRIEGAAAVGSGSMSVSGLRVGDASGS